MSHMDEGTLHAYLDGAVDAPAERGRIEDHLRLCADCSALLHAARRDRDEAREVLALLDPGEVRVSDFEAMVRPIGGGGGPVAGRARLPLAWAASLVLAVGGGWMGREVFVSVQVDPPGRFAPAMSTDAEGPAERAAPEAPFEETARTAAPGPQRARQEAASGPPTAAGETVAAQPAASAAGARMPDSRPGAAPDTLERAGEAVARGATTLAPERPQPVGALSLAAEPQARVIHAPAGDRLEAVEGAELAAFVAYLRSLAADAAWTPVDEAEIHVLLGRGPAVIEGLAAEAVERLDQPDIGAGSRVIVRVRYRVDDGERVTLFQSPASAWPPVSPLALIEHLRAEVDGMSAGEISRSPMSGRGFDELLVVAQGVEDRARLRAVLDRVIVPGVTPPER